MREPFQPTEAPPPSPESAYRDLKSAISPRLYRDVMKLQVEYRETTATLYDKRPPWHYKRDIGHLTTMLAKRYLPIVTEIREALAADELRALQQILEHRLDRGLEVEGGEELFLRLCDEYEVVCDATAESVLHAKLARLTDLKERLVPA